MKSKTRPKDLFFYGSLIILVALFFAGAILFKVYEIEILPSPFFGALMGVFITAFVTAFLLRGQTEGDEKREKSVKVFEKKQEVYHTFLEKFQKIIQNGDIQIGTKKEDGGIDYTTDELKDLIFQLGYIQMHANKDTTNNVFERVSIIIQEMNNFNSEKDKEKYLAKFYASLSEEIFGIVSVLKRDLYDDSNTETIEKNKIEDLLRECNLFIETNELKKHELQLYFWAELQELLAAKGYDIKWHDFKQDVDEYYARARNRHRWYGIEFPVYQSRNGETITFKIEVENEYYYGFIRPEPNKEDNEIAKLIRSISESYKTNEYWYGYKYSSRYRLNFWNSNSPEFERLKHPIKRKQLLHEIAEEIDTEIQKFLKKADEEHL